MTVPDWLQLRDGRLQRGLNNETWLVMINQSPEYKLVASPAGGQYTCAITQTNNAKRLDNGVKYPTADAALRGGLLELRAKLGW